MIDTIYHLFFFLFLNSLNWWYKLKNARIQNNTEYFSIAKEIFHKRIEQMSEEQLYLRLGKLVVKKDETYHDAVQAWQLNRRHLQNHLQAWLDLIDMEISLIRELIKRRKRGDRSQKS